MEPDQVSALIAGCIGGDDAAKAEFISAYDDLVRRSVMRKLYAASGGREFESDVEDICHDVYIRLFRNNCSALTKLRKPRSIDAWLMTVSQNHVYSFLRKRKVQLSKEAFVAREHSASYEESPERSAVVAENLSLMRDRIKGLEPKDRLILRLYYVHGLKYAEIAETLGLNINTVASRLMRAKARLRESLSEDIS